MFFMIQYMFVQSSNKENNSDKYDDIMQDRKETSTDRNGQKNDEEHNIIITPNKQQATKKKPTKQANKKSTKTLEIHVWCVHAVYMHIRAIKCHQCYRK